MRGIEAVLLAAFVGLLALGAWNARQWLPQWGGKQVNPVAANTAKSVDKPANKPRKQSGGNGTTPRNARVLRPSDLALAGFPLSETQIEVPPSQLPFPTRADLPVGASGLQIRAKYGEPAARVTEMREGQLFERYFYLNNDRTQLTVATLKGGIVTRAESVSR